jgi:cephalosporin hydroxylase
MEIGMWDGGSAVFWHEILKPKKMIGIDLLKDGGTEIYKKYKTEHPNTFFDYWDTSQTDKKKLTEILNRHLNGEELDLVFDDASHRYHQSLDSFNIVFPYVKKGGYYIIEDWAWGHWLHENSDVYPAFTEPTRLITELMEATANIGLIESIHVCSGFTAVKRGQLDISKENFNLHDHILRRPVSLKDRLKRRAKIVLGRSW